MESERSERIRNKAFGFITLAIEKGNSLAESRPGSKRAIAAGTASTLMEIGLEQLTKSKTSDDLTEEQISQIESIEPSAEDVKPQLSKHFTDRIFEKLIQSSLPPDIDIPNGKDSDEEDRTSKQSLSVSLLVHNLRKITEKLTAYFVVQYGILHIITWKRPTKTLTALVMYTSVCLRPYLVLVYPLMYVLFGILIPGYVHRHPMKRPDLIKVQGRGQSIWQFFSSHESSIVDDYIEDDYVVDDNVSIVSDSPSLSMSLAPSEYASSTDEFIKDAKKKKNSQLALIRNMKEIQKLSTDLLRAIELAETFYYETGGFKDERLSTFIFYGLLLAAFLILFVGKYIPWRMIFILAGWIILTLCHPSAKKYLLELKSKKRIPNDKPKPITDSATSKDKKLFDRADIIVDDAPDIATVEVYELQTRTSFNAEWTFYKYSTSMFGRNDKLRISKKRPNGVEDLSRVLPPKDWMFDFGLVNKWKVDMNPGKLIQERDFNANLFNVHEKEKEGWIYDNSEALDTVDFDFQVRRRRLFRDCFRYGRPHYSGSSC